MHAHMTKTPPRTPDFIPNGNGNQSRSALSEGLKRLAEEDHPAGLRLGARLRNYFLTGLIIVGPVTITIYIIWWFINYVDTWVKPLVPHAYLPETYLPFASRASASCSVSSADAHWRARRQPARPLADFLRRDGARQHADRAQRLSRAETDLRIRGQRHRPGADVQKVGLIEFPSKGIWSIVFVTGEGGGDRGRQTWRRR